ncbi:nhaS3, partial [Symbiodinium pilosum]
LGPILGASDVKVGVVSTLRDVQDQLMQWLEWFRLIGFAHMFLYFDDPEHDEAAIEEARATYSSDFVSFCLYTGLVNAACCHKAQLHVSSLSLRHGEQLREEWQHLRSWPKFSKYTDDRMCRQLLNIAHALKRAACETENEAVDWVIHLDHDELFLPP